MGKGGARVRNAEIMGMGRDAPERACIFNSSSKFFPPVGTIETFVLGAYPDSP